MNQPSVFWPTGTVYGTLLNFRGELQALGEQLSQPPYLAPPVAPVLYVKTANTWSANGSPIPVPAHEPQVEVGASIALVIGLPHGQSPDRARAPRVAAYVLVNDLSLPQTNFFRPPVKYNCLDGFLGLGPRCVPFAQAGDPARFVLEVRINDVLRQTLRFAELVRDANRLLADVCAFMTLREGDLLMLGCDAPRPLAAVGDRIDICAPALRAFGTLGNTLVAAGEEET